MKRIAVAALALAACTGSHGSGSAAKIVIASQQSSGLTVDLLSAAPLATGLTPVYLRVATAAGEAVTDAAVTFTPWMGMSTGHGAPMLGPPSLGADGLYRCDVVFQMAGSWTATVSVTRPSAATIDVAFPDLPVADSGRAQTFVGTDGTSYVASFDLEEAPCVGLNPVTVTLHARQDASTFPPVDDATLALDPQMAAMGHGGGECVDPTLASPGVYRGQVGFTMPGEWQTTLTVTRGGAAIATPVFGTTF